MYEVNIYAPMDWIVERADINLPEVEVRRMEFAGGISWRFYSEDTFMVAVAPPDAIRRAVIHGIRY